MGRVVVFDCESDGLPLRGCRGRTDAFASVQCTVVCAIVLIDGEKEDVCTTELVIWCDGPVHEGASGPFEALFQEFDRADVIIGYNALDFDMPLLAKYYGGGITGPGPGRLRYRQHRLKVLDPFARIRAITELWPKLDKLLVGNGLEAKTSTGAQAVQWWRSGERRLLREYCMADVRCVAQLVELPSLRLDDWVIPSHVYSVRGPQLGGTVTPLAT